jgi:5-methylthioribose kinase
MAFDIGAVLANLLLAYFSRDWHDRFAQAGKPPYRDWLLEQVAAIWALFAEKFATLWRDHESRSETCFLGADRSGTYAEAFRARFIERLFSESLGFAGCKMIRRIVGMAKVEDITSIGDDALRAAVEVRVLRCAEQLLVQRHTIADIDSVVLLARDIQSKGQGSA